MHDLFSSPVCPRAVRLGARLNKPYRSLLWGGGRTRPRRLKERLRHDRLLALLDVRPYFLQCPLPLGGNYIVARRAIKADRCVPNRGVTTYQLSGVGINLHGAALEHQYAVILTDIPLAVDDEDALGCFQKGVVYQGRRVQRLAREAEEWLFSDDARGPFSFVSICAVLGLEPPYLRRGLRRWRQGGPQAEVKKPPRIVSVPRRLAWRRPSLDHSGDRAVETQ